MHTMKIYLVPIARVLMSSLFIWDGFLQLRHLGETIEYLVSLKVPFPNVAIWFSIALHLLGGVAILVGFKIRWASSVLALFCLGTAIAVHLPLGDTENMVNFYKNLVMAGGFLYVVAYGAGIMSIDGVNRA